MIERKSIIFLSFWVRVPPVGSTVGRLCLSNCILCRTRREEIEPCRIVANHKGRKPNHANLTGGNPTPQHGGAETEWARRGEANLVLICRALLCFVLLCFTLLCFAQLFYAMLCVALLYLPCLNLPRSASLCSALLCSAPLRSALICSAPLCSAI